MLHVCPARLRYSFFNVVVQGIIEHLCDLFHKFAWTTVRNDAPTGACLSGRDGVRRRRLCLEDLLIRWGRAVPPKQGKGRRTRKARKWSAVRLDGVASTQTRVRGRWDEGPLPEESEQRQPAVLARWRNVVHRWRVRGHQFSETASSLERGVARLFGPQPDTPATGARTQDT